MFHYEIQPHTRRCAATGRELQPGEKYHGVLVEEGHRLLRRDYSTESWKGSPDGTFSFWTARVPVKEQARKLRIDGDALLNYFERLDGPAGASNVNFRYVLALLLLRSRRLKLVETRLEDGHEIVRLRCIRGGTYYDVVNPRLSEAELTAVQEQVVQVVGWE